MLFFLSLCIVTTKRHTPPANGERDMGCSGGKRQELLVPAWKAGRGQTRAQVVPKAHMMVEGIRMVQLQSAVDMSKSSTVDDKPTNTHQRRVIPECEWVGGPLDGFISYQLAAAFGAIFHNDQRL